mmetsp:Transcript_12994/g.15249  ORF Transcript_12994/g.15249 Transcript_12994/m.15249 type:complete len:197 (+) Transcript_12994:155-745(+)|eukprot:CAMPEP_0198252296 /NCGR_PEP_ID=MMETSP1447-20131203/2807_1 /TAXON_ID=420782 /ORGANISM="Chaetoceros dichaeta, Strain CCMP1751" /LENGTH=196 /DNA_ID=CAMNT_0043937483 /DNA_START=150 /DNA_END=740 /DNA_ORIENTATION=+
MFLPGNKTTDAAKAKADAERNEAYTRIEDWTREEIPLSIRDGVNISVQEVICGDPTCAPIDTAIAIIFPSGGRGMMGLPAESKDVLKEDLLEGFPTNEVLEKWSRGEEAEWPPFDDEEDFTDSNQPQLRFEVGEKVECRIGPDEVTGWAKGSVMQLWYREQGWPPNSWAPYKIQLDDGKCIFAPSDLDQIIRKAQT